VIAVLASGPLFSVCAGGGETPVVVYGLSKVVRGVIF